MPYTLKKKQPPDWNAIKRECFSSSFFFSPWSNRFLMSSLQLCCLNFHLLLLCCCCFLTFLLTWGLKRPDRSCVCLNDLRTASVIKELIDMRHEEDEQRNLNILFLLLLFFLFLFLSQFQLGSYVTHSPLCQTKEPACSGRNGRYNTFFFCSSSLGWRRQRRRRSLMPLIWSWNTTMMMMMIRERERESLKGSSMRTH